MPDDSDTKTPGREPSRIRPISPISLLLLVPFVGTLWVPLYNRVEPALFGFPFFYWYLFLWVAIGAALNALVYFVTRQRRADKAKSRDQGLP